jgi:tetraacyldisaccharide-1-P 4'-kinase
LIDRRGDVARFGDEAVMMASTLEAEAHVWAGPLERCLGRAARERPDAIVVDDGLGLPRRPGNVSIALLSADRLCHRRLPAGPLRRPLADTARADVVGIRVGDGPGSPTSVEGRASELLAAASADRPWFAFRLRPVGDGRGARVYLASGIANVERFRRSAEQVRYTVVGRTWFPDHHLPSRRDLGDLEEAARSRAAHAILVTAKDAPRFPPSLGPLPVRVLETTVQLIRNSHVLEGAIEELCAGQGG